jgi:hypothetical protein
MTSDKYTLGAAALIFLAVTTHAAQSITEITLPGTRVFPESITSTSDGTLIVGSLGTAMSAASRVEVAWPRNGLSPARAG